MGLGAGLEPPPGLALGSCSSGGRRLPGAGGRGRVPAGQGLPVPTPLCAEPRGGTGTGTGSGAAEGRGRPLRPRPQPGCAASHRAVAARPLSDWLGASRALNYP